MKRIYEIDGKDFSSLAEFYDQISRALIPGAIWGRNLDAFNDILRGGFGTPDGGFVLRWLNSDVSKQRLGAEKFDQLMDIIRLHGPGGDESADNVELELL